MNPVTKIVRRMGGLFLLLHLICIFFPFFYIVQEHHIKKTVSQYWEVRSLFANGITGFGKGLEGDVMGVIVLCILLPLILSVIIGIWGIVGNKGHKIFGIGAILVALLDAGFLWNMEMFFPAKNNGTQEIQMGFSRYILIAIAILCALFGVIVFICELDNKLLKKANIIFNTGAEDSPSISKGVMVGLSGIFEGAEITFQPGETLKLGRDNSNHLIFTQADSVSRNHCEITWCPAQRIFQILDYSSNGCFINGREECIPQNIILELKPGTVLDIGNAANRFWLR